MKRLFGILFLVVAFLQMSAWSATSRFERLFTRASGLPLVGATIYLVPQANTYPTGALPLTPVTGKPGVYGRDAVPDGEYKVYIDQGTGVVLHQERLYIGEQRLTAIANRFNANNELTTPGIAIGSVTGQKLALWTVSAANLTLALVQWIESQGGGSVTNFPDEVTLTAYLLGPDTVLGVKPGSLGFTELSTTLKNVLARLDTAQTFQGITTFQDKVIALSSIDGSGAIRATGTSSFATGIGVEIGYDAGGPWGFVTAKNTGTAAFVDLLINGRDIILDPESGREVSVRGPLEADGDLRVDLNGYIIGNLVIGDSAGTSNRLFVEGRSVFHGNVTIDTNLTVEYNVQLGGILTADTTVSVYDTWAKRNLIAGDYGTLATTATSGFLYISTMGGAPTGDPVDLNGDASKAPMVWDIYNKRLYIYDFDVGQWKEFAPL